MNDSSTYIIAEMACSHDGNESYAKTIIDCAGQNGANAIQFQIWRKESMVTLDHPDFPLLSSLELSHTQWEALTHYVRCTYPSMEIIACIYELESLKFCSKINVDALKIHVADISNYDFLASVGEERKRVDLSIGACTIAEILDASNILKANGCPEIWLMYGLQNFPTPAGDVDLKYLKNLERLTGFRSGYQDHSDPENITSFSMPAAAIGLGINIIEKHLTHDRSLKGADYQAALNPDEFSTFMEMVRDIDQATSGGTVRPITDAEKKYRQYARKSIIARNLIPKGTIINTNDLTVLRASEFGVDPRFKQSIIGKIAQQDIPSGKVIFEDDFA